MDKKQSQSIGSNIDSVPNNEDLKKRAEENAEINHPEEPAVIRADDIEQARQDLLSHQQEPPVEETSKPSPIVGRSSVELMDKEPGIPEDQKAKLEKLTDQGVREAEHEKRLSASEEQEKNKI